MEDSFYYKIRSVENDLKWVAAEFSRKDADIVKQIPSEAKRKHIREMMQNIKKYAHIIHSKFGAEFVSEFSDPNEK